MVGPKPALVTLYPDGSVLVTAGGTEMGQGLFTKAKQVRLAFCPCLLVSPIKTFVFVVSETHQGDCTRLWFASFSLAQSISFLLCLDPAWLCSALLFSDNFCLDSLFYFPVHKILLEV